MKLIRNILLIATGLSMASCNYLDVNTDTKDRMSLEEVFTDETYTEQWLANAYSYLTNSEFADISITGSNPFNFSDDIYNPIYKSFKEVTYGEEQWPYTWKYSYQGIRQAAIFIQNVDMCNELTSEERADYKAQARFVRAYYYWKLLQKYGPVPIVPEEGQDYTDSYEALSIPRNTYDECADYIASEMALAAKDLPLKRELMSVSRPTRGAALAVRAKALLYAASPLMNGNTDGYAEKLVDDKGNRLLAAAYDEKKWARAAAAAKDVIDLKAHNLYVAYKRTEGFDGYPVTLPPYDDGNFSTKSWPNGYKDIDPFESYRSVFNGELSTVENPELIFTRGNNQGSYGVNYMVFYQLPVSKAKGNNTTCVTQKQCDAYYMKDGKDIPGKDIEIGRGDGSSQRVTGFVTASDVSKGLYKPLEENVSLQYANREPRFYASVAYNGVTWWLTNATQSSDRGPYRSWYYRGETEGMSNSLNWLQTGIGLMKYVRPTDTNDDKNINGEFSHISKKADPLIRYADILLMYAEALNELDGSYQIETWDNSGTHSISRDVDELKKGVQPVRIRAGIPDFTPEEYGNKELFRKKIKRERQIELMAEGQRYFDLRRWKDAKDEESLPMYGCNVFMTKGERDLFYKPVPVSDVLTCFAEKTYFWPIDRSELEKNVRLTQNPGWQSEK